MMRHSQERKQVELAQVISVAEDKKTCKVVLIEEGKLSVEATIGLFNADGQSVIIPKVGSYVVLQEFNPNVRHVCKTSTVEAIYMIADQPIKVQVGDTTLGDLLVRMLNLLKVITFATPAGISAPAIQPHQATIDTLITDTEHLLQTTEE